MKEITNIAQSKPSSIVLQTYPLVLSQLVTGNNVAAVDIVGT